uniref:Uncharacterized protein n=1 Tax=Kalanchoe fedtschenkoi TaxID=63787 RepID=A0A7N0ULK4_KALFE
MGCCLSRTTSPSTKPTPYPKNAPPPPLDEETVKEVLTETPIAAVLDDQPLKKIGAAEKLEAKVVGEKKSVMVEEKQRIEAVEIQSVEVEVSEMTTVATENRSAVSVSVSESVSAATAGGEEVMSKGRERERGEGVTSSRHQRSSDQSPAKVPRRRPYSGELTTSNGPKEKRVRSPANRAVPSPEKNTQVAPRAVRGRSQSPATSKQRNGGPAKIRRDGGERSGRRSRSPATNAFRNSSNRSGLVSEDNGGEVRKRGVAEEEEPADKESLDNPLVSLECFIFL